MIFLSRRTGHESKKALGVVNMNDLTTTEQASLERYERVIEQGLQSFYEVGSALLTIRDSKLYRGTHGTFEAYCLDRWGMTNRYANNLIASTKTIDNLGTTVPIPSSERVARPLTALPPDKQSEAWQQAVATAPDGKVTAAHVASVVKEMTGKPKPVVNKPIIKSEPVSPEFQTAFDQMVVEIKNARAMKWKTTSHKGAIELMQILLTIAEQ